MLIDRKARLWQYLDEDLQGLVSDGEALLDDLKVHRIAISDYSYLVFPFSKAYEGFLKKMFYDLKLIDRSSFYSDDIRIGRILNPNFTHESSSVYERIPHHLPDNDLSKLLWTVWKNGRNLVFHYYPHNFRKLEYGEALGIIKEIVAAMEKAVKVVYYE